ncbi:Uncharacterized conserved protein, DUF1015 family [Modestobacter sp. DSM 44400]|uniref:DUF1015 domain-containing protein n=1 Tax=Modestobacter sp. DSM 44400 TaxID=1550230 RepID=UPI00089D56D5|nr:DUF1015 domain-containing protein [Modestobacter sp. DSM 44400]SDX97760.1 Uncharacterized conserved protein, DUF1015 family [Modestobacter sp. DSM 44400]
MPPSPAADPPSGAGGLDVRPFRALTYRQHDPADLARVSSPAYDLVTAAGRNRLAAADPHNIVRLILPHVERAGGERTDAAMVGPGSAETAAGTLRDWLDQGVLDRDALPALWRYEMAAPGSGPTTGWLGAVGLPRSGSSAVLPHEDTFAPAVEGRRALLAATHTDLEPIVLAHDPDDEVTALTVATGASAPTLQVADPDGVTHRLWRVTDPAVLDRLVRALAGTRAVIADGHHRFAAAREHQRSGHVDSGAVLSLVTPMGPGGLQVRAIHRVVPDLALDTALATAADGFQVSDRTPADGDVVAVVDRWTTTGGRVGFLVTDGTRVAELTSPAPAVLDAIPAEAPTAWRGLDVVLAHHGLFGRLWGRRDDPASVLVAHDVAEALQLGRERAGVAVLLHSPSPADVAAVARAGARMPRKSTLFVPKPRTGLVLRPHGG